MTAARWAAGVNSILIFLVSGSMLLARAVSESGEQVRRDSGNLVAKRNFQDDPTSTMNAGDRLNRGMV
jgi:hypothetical protein